MAKKLSKKDLTDWYVIGLTDFINLMSTDLPPEFEKISEFEVKGAIIDAITQTKDRMKTEVY